VKDWAVHRRFAVVVRRLRYGWLGVVEATLAASLAWELDTRLLHHRQAFFAPAAALIVLAQVQGQRIRRAIEIVLGVSAGIFIADLVARALGPHSTGTVFVVILLTLTAALVVGAGPLLVVQASVSALYVAVVAAPGSAPVTNRLVDALVGGGIAVIVSQAHVVRQPLRPLTDQLTATLNELAAIFEAIAAAVELHDEDAARAVLARARQTEGLVAQTHSAALAAEEGFWLYVRRRQRVAGVRAIEQSVNQLDFAVRGSRVLARASVTLTRQGTAAPPSITVALNSLATTSRAVLATLVSELTGDEREISAQMSRTRDAARDAVRAAATALQSDTSLPLVMLVGQIRLTAVDLLRAGSADSMEMLEEFDAMLGLAIR
jgi:uncharacterized membrane protein YgaE (UPF0421/DUF939 family)